MREERQLTYDASFSYVHSEGISGGWYTVAVTASPETVALAIRACQEALQSLRGAFGVLGDSVQAAKRTLLNKHRADVLTNKHWASMLAGTQCDHIAGKPPAFRNTRSFLRTTSGCVVRYCSLCGRVH